MTANVEERLVSWEDIQDIELVVLRRMKEFTSGVHQSVFQGSGFDLVGLREWEPGDLPASVDWAQSSLTNFTPLITREFEQERTASVVIVADTSQSTQCGVNGTSIAKVIARTVATLGLGAACLQDRVGLVTMAGTSQHLAVRLGIGKSHAIHCLDVYQEALTAKRLDSVPIDPRGLGGVLRSPSLIPVVSDFLVEDPEPLAAAYASLNTLHDVFLVMIDSAFAFQLPVLSAGWLEGYDVESGRAGLFSAHELKLLSGQVREWQEATTQVARQHGLDVVHVKPGAEHEALVVFLQNRRSHRR